MSEEYNGWANFETWSAALVLDETARVEVEDVGVEAAASTLDSIVCEEIENAIGVLEDMGGIVAEFSKFLWYAYEKIDFEEIAKAHAEE